ncbi:MAG: hypothetical protein FGM22_10330 [Burkholderiaceae bacterium]|nr:hypothetical protein [Burkholderiaceae bacterium]
MTRAQITKWIEQMETQTETSTMDEWAFGQVIGGADASFQYAENIRTGERSFDMGFIEQVITHSRDRIRATGKHEAIHVQIGPSDDGSDQALFAQAIAAGVIKPTALRSPAAFRPSCDADSEDGSE